MDILAPSHVLLLLLLVLIIFGPSRLGDVGGALGRGIRDFKRAINERDSDAVSAARAADIVADSAAREKTAGTFPRSVSQILGLPSSETEKIATRLP